MITASLNPYKGSKLAAFSGCSNSGILITVCLLPINPYRQSISSTQCVKIPGHISKWLETFHYIIREISEVHVKFLVLKQNIYIYCIYLTRLD